MTVICFLLNTECLQIRVDVPAGTLGCWNTTGALLLAGAMAGAITGIATTPLDVIKTRLMTQGSNRTYAGVADAFSKIWQEEGAAAFLSVSCSRSKMHEPYLVM